MKRKLKKLFGCSILVGLYIGLGSWVAWAVEGSFWANFAGFQLIVLGCLIFTGLLFFAINLIDS